MHILQWGNHRLGMRYRHRGNRLKRQARKTTNFTIRGEPATLPDTAVYKTFKTPTTGFTTTYSIETFRKVFYSSTLLRNKSYLWRMRHRSSQLVRCRARKTRSKPGRRFEWVWKRGANEFTPTLPKAQFETCRLGLVVVGLVLRWWMTSLSISCSSLCSDQILLYSSFYVMQFRSCDILPLTSPPPNPPTFHEGMKRV